MGVMGIKTDWTWLWRYEDGIPLKAKGLMYEYTVF